MTDNTAVTDLDKLISLLHEKFGTEKALITEDTVLESLDLDSLALVELFLLIEKRMGVIIEIGDIKSNNTAGDLARRLSLPVR